jgi:hypothetical protein
MILVSTTTGLSKNQIVDQATEFFGEGGLGLTEAVHDQEHVCFEGGGGYVCVWCADRDGSRVVDVESREWELHARRFAARI